MDKKLLCFSLLFSAFINLTAQWQKTGELELDQNPTAISADINGDIYLGYNDGNFIKYTNKGEEVINFALPSLSSISLIEPQFQLKTFIFYFDIQQITILDRFNTVPKNYLVKEFSLGLVSMACPAPDGTFWLLENNPTLLRRVEPHKKTIILETQPFLGNEIRTMRSYQNILLIVDEMGLHVFDQFGSELFFYEAEDINSISFWNNYVHFESNDLLIKMNPFSGEIINEQIGPVSQIKSLIYSKKVYLLLTNKKVSWYQLE